MENTNTQLTAEESATLESVRAERIKAETDLLREKARYAELQSQARTNGEREAIRSAVNECGIRFYNAEDAVVIAKKDYGLTYGADGVASGIVDGHKASLTAVLEAIATKYPSLADQRTTRHLREPEPEPLNRATMTRQEKIEYLRTHTAEEFEALPSRPPMKTVPVQFFEDYLALPQSARMEFIRKAGPETVGRLPRKDPNAGVHRFGLASGV